MKTPSTEAGSLLTDEQIDKIADEHLSYQEESRSASGIYEFANACARAALSAASPPEPTTTTNLSGRCAICHAAYPCQHTLIIPSLDPSGASSRGAVQRQDGDTERLDWLQDHGATLVHGLNSDRPYALEWIDENGHIKRNDGDSLRACIRAAMKEHP